MVKSGVATKGMVKKLRAQAAANPDLKEIYEAKIKIMASGKHFAKNFDDVRNEVGEVIAKLSLIYGEQ
jgi:hypothetical protein